MAKKHVHSQDPRKPKILAALKRKSGGTKVTLLTEIEPGIFEGKCQKPEIIKDGGFAIKTGKYEDLGMFVVNSLEAGL